MLVQMAKASACKITSKGLKCPKTPVFTYHVNMDERGTFDADVRNSKDKTVFEIHVEAGTESEDNNIFQDGFMKHGEDIGGLQEYLQDLKIIPKNAIIKPE